MPKGKSKAGKAKTSKGLSVQTFAGLNKKRLAAAASGGGGQRVKLVAGTPIPLQFLTTPAEFKEYRTHSFREDGSWTYVPCLGKKICPLCKNEEEDVSKTSYRFCANVYNVAEKKVQILDNGSEMAQQIFYRWERSPKKFLKKLYEASRFDGKRTSYEVIPAEEQDDALDEKALKKLKLHDLQAYIDDGAKRYYGDELPEEDALDDDDDDESDDDDDDADSDDDEDDDDDGEDLDDMGVSELKKKAKELGIKPVPSTKPKLIKAITAKLAEGGADDDDEDDGDDSDDDEETYTEAQLEDMDEDELVEAAEKFNLDQDDYDDWDDLREAILEAQEESGDDDSDDDDEEDDEPPKKAKKASKTLPAKKVAKGKGKKK